MHIWHLQPVLVMPVTITVILVMLVTLTVILVMLVTLTVSTGNAGSNHI